MAKLRQKTIMLLTISCLFLVACAEKEVQGNDVNYEETKKMLVDILKSDEGKEALNDILADEKFRQSIVMDQAVVKQSIQDSLLSEQAEEFWKKQLEDPKFAETLAKSTQKQQETLMKGLMNDPEYQQKVIEIMQNPEMEKRFISHMTSDKFRKHIQERIIEAFENPIFRVEVYNMVEQVVKEEQKGGKDEGKDNKSAGDAE